MMYEFLIISKKLMMHESKLLNKIILKRSKLLNKNISYSILLVERSNGYFIINGYFARRLVLKCEISKLILF